VIVLDWERSLELLSLFILLRTECGLMLYIPYFRQARGACLMPLSRARLTKERSGLVLMARTLEHQPIVMELSQKVPMLGIGLSMVLKLSGDSNEVAASKAFDDINL